MPPKEKYSNPQLRDEVKEEIKESDKGGAPGQWSARKAQMMAKEYKKRGGDYNTPKSDKDESQQNLEKWGEEDWQTKDGSANAKKSDGSRKRYLPKKAWEEMSEGEKQATDEKKQNESKGGKQFVENTPRAKRARKDANEKEDQDHAAKQQDQKDGDDDGDDSKGPPAKVTEAKKANQGKKRGRSDKHDAGEDEKGDADAKGEPPTKKTQSKKGKVASGESGKTIGSKKDKATPPAKQASLDRLPKKGTQAYWKAMPGWVDGKVVEVLKKGKSVDGKQVKASQDDPKVVLKSNSSGKICVHKIDNVYFD